MLYPYYACCDPLHPGILFEKQKKGMVWYGTVWYGMVNMSIMILEPYHNVEVR